MEELPPAPPWYVRPNWWQCILLSAGVIALAAAVELAMGRVPISKSGTIRLWVSEVNGPETSQQLLDWCSFTHVLHGFLCYGLFRLLGRGRWSIGLCLVLSVLLESGWEVLENTPFAVERYRKTTISVDYYGDSVLNSVADILCCVLGFGLAARLPAWLTVALFVATEVGLAWAVHDNLTLNVLMLLYPIEGIKHWQMSVG